MYVNNNLSNISYSWPVKFVGNGESLKTVVNKYCKSNTSQKYILNRIADSPFVYDGTTIISGSLTLDYSSGYWNNHPLYTLISESHVYTGTINMSEWKVDTIVCHATKSDLNTVLMYRGVIAGDLNRGRNLAIAPGIYSIQSASTITNGPSDFVGWGIFVQFPDNLFSQMILNSPNYIKFRKYSGSNPSWGAW